MVGVGVVRDLDLDEIAALDVEHRDVREDAAVDRPLHARATVEETRLLRDGELEAAVERGRGVERHLRWAAISQRVEGRELCGNGRSSPICVESERRTRLHEREPDWRAGHGEGDIRPTSAGDVER